MRKRSVWWLSCCYRWRHLLFNVVAQLVVGVPLELMHGTLRTALIYLTGILAGIIPYVVSLSFAISQRSERPI